MSSGPPTTAEAFAAAADAMEHPRFVLRLFVTGMTPRSTSAIRAVRAVCEARLKDRYELDIIDVYQQPKLIQNEQIFATPTLVKYSPHPLRKIIGDMSNQSRLIIGLGLAPENP